MIHDYVHVINFLLVIIIQPSACAVLSYLQCLGRLSLPPAVGQ